MAGARAEDQGLQQRGAAAGRRRPGGWAGGCWAAGCRAALHPRRLRFICCALLPAAPTHPTPLTSCWWPRPRPPSGCRTQWPRWRRRWGRGVGGWAAWGHATCSPFRRPEAWAPCCSRCTPPNPPTAHPCSPQLEQFEADLEALGPARGRNRPPRCVRGWVELPWWAARMGRWAGDSACCCAWCRASAHPSPASPHARTSCLAHPPTRPPQRAGAGGVHGAAPRPRGQAGAGGWG